MNIINGSWLSGYPDKQNMVMATGLDDMFDQSKLPMFRIKRLCMEHLATYTRGIHLITLNKIYLSSMTERRFISVLLHEIGHSTTAFTNRLARLEENAGFDRNQRYAIEEVFAEILSVVMYSTIYCRHEVSKSSIKYIAQWDCQSKTIYPWGEVEVALESIISKPFIDNFLCHADMLRYYLERNNIIKIRKGLYL
jgi:hypothetical protein